MKKEEIADSVSQALHLPDDMLSGAPIMTVLGRRKLHIENYKGIIEYTPERIRVQTKHGRIHICGKHLLILVFTQEDMEISGYISTIEFC